LIIEIASFFINALPKYPKIIVGQTYNNAGYGSYVKDTARYAIKRPIPYEKIH
jgi:hypothetical protein